MRIAIIDDERQWVAYTKKFISNHYEGRVTEIDGYLSGLEFMKKLKQYDIVIMDLESKRLIIRRLV